MVPKWVRDFWDILYNIAVDVLSVSATAAPVERVFSRASYILSKKDYNWYAYTYTVHIAYAYAICIRF